MTTVDSTLSLPTLTEHARRLAATLGERAGEIEAGRRLPADLLDEMVAAGYFRILLPPSHGGIGATPVEALELYETLARGDASTGWTVMIGATGWLDLAELPRSAFDALFAPSANVIVAGVFAPTGSISPIDGGYELTGRWAFASGCEHATHLFLNAVEGFADGHPLMRGSVLERADVEIEDTWDAVGMCGTGSHHVSVSGAVVAPERTFVPLAGTPCVDAPIARVPTPSMFAMAIAAVAVGTAAGALDEVVELAQRKVPLLAPGTLATSDPFQRDLARAAAGVDAGRALLLRAADQLWDRAVSGDAATLDDRAAARAAAVWATEAALAAGEFAFAAGGGDSVYRDSPLQRRLRDLRVVAQHFLVRPDTYVAVGAVRAHQPLPVPVF